MKEINAEAEGMIACQIWGLGSDGTVGANKQAIKIIGEHSDLKVQAYFDYDSKKSGGLTVSHLRFGKSKIQSTYYVNEADFIACHNQAYVEQYNLLKGLKKGGIFILNCMWDEKEIAKHIPAYMKRYMANNDIGFYTIDATSVANEIGLGNRINMVMQAAFFKLANVIPVEDAVKYLKDAVEHTYGKKGEKIVKMNNAAIDRGISDIKKIEIPADWADARDDSEVEANVPEFIEEILIPMTRQEGDDLPVSAFEGREDGTFPSGTAAYEKRGVAVSLPKWIPENCIQCNQCSFVCPHASIRPALADQDEKSKAPAGFETIKAIGKGLEGLEYRVQLSPMDCMGCGNCADICPSKKKALIMVPFDDLTGEKENWNYFAKLPLKDKLLSKDTVKGSQFAKPYLEFSGACAGCGETPYIKLITQLYGDRMMIANATGCSSIWGAAAPSMPYCTDENGRGPSWANSLFEDNAEYGLGMFVATKQMREKLTDSANALLTMNIPEDLSAALEGWLADKDEGALSRDASEKLMAAIDGLKTNDKEVLELTKDIIDRKDFLVKKSVWALGGDGWAYDIGYGGLDHVLASGENINILVFDTEVYSNTGGQSSKSTPAAAIAKFAASGKRIKKKDLGMMAMSYGYVYVAQVGMGADKNQFMKAVIEAEKYNGPSIIIAYAPCINHGIKKGMGKAQENIKDAVEAGYWHLYRYNPELKKEGKNPFTLDSKAPSTSFKDYILGQVRYSSLAQEFPDVADKLFEMSEENAHERYNNYKRMADNK